MISTSFRSVLPSRVKISGESPIVSSKSGVRSKHRSVIVSAATFATAETERTTGTASPFASSTAVLASAASPTSFYELLGIPMGASSQEIKAAYRRLARACHPDVAGLNRKDSSADEFMKIHAAYSTLSDPEKRADYDRRIFPRNRSYGRYSTVRASASSSSMPRYSGYTGRNWETDQCW